MNNYHMAEFAGNSFEHTTPILPIHGVTASMHAAIHSAEKITSIIKERRGVRRSAQDRRKREVRGVVGHGRPADDGPTFDACTQ